MLTSFIFSLHSDASKYSESRCSELKFSESKYSESMYPESNYSDSLYSESACASACASTSVSACVDNKYKSVMVMSEEKDECVIATEVCIIQCDRNNYLTACSLYSHYFTLSVTNGDLVFSLAQV